MIDNDLINNYNKLPAIEQLNLFRNLYYTDGNDTEKGIIANALNEILPMYVKLREQLERLVRAGNDVVEGFHKGENIINYEDYPEHYMWE